MNSIAKLRGALVSGDYHTLTLDIFDTVLLRDIHPEDEQFLLAAEKQSKALNSSLKLAGESTISAYEFYSWRQYTRREVQGAWQSYDNSEKQQRSHEAALEEWFGRLVTLLASKRGLDIDTDKKAKLVGDLIKIELVTEKAHLTPNSKLVEVLKEAKSREKIRIYFVSDMYLTTQQVQSLLNYFKIGSLFDGGITSVDAHAGKWDGGLYYRLSDADIFGEDFDIFHNLHFGDSKYADYNMARKAGSDAIWYREQSQKVKRATERGSHRIDHLTKSVIRGSKHSLRQELSHDNEPRDIWVKYGELFSLPMYIYLSHIFTVAATNPDTTFLMVSSEATSFAQFMDEDFGEQRTANVKVANKLNRRMMIRALAYQAASGGDIDLNARVISQIVKFGEIDGSPREVYGFLFGKDFPVSELTLNARSKNEFYEGLVRDIQTAPGPAKEVLRGAYEHVEQILDGIATDNLVIVDVGWGGTVQVLLEQFCQSAGKGINVDGLYLGAYRQADRFKIKPVPLHGYLLNNIQYGKDKRLWNAVIWEYAYTNKIQFPADETRLALVAEGFRQGIEFYRHIELDPKTYFDKVVRPKIQHLLTSPTRAEVATLGDIEFDSGFVNFLPFHLVEESIGTRNMWRMLIRHPRGTLRNVVFKQNCWPAGYMKYYHLIGLKTVYRIYGKLRHMVFV